MKPGIYPDLGEEGYFAAEGVNSSLLRVGARSWKQALHYITAPRKESTPAQVIGSLCHRAVLEPKRADAFAIKPKGMSFATKEGKAWRDTEGSNGWITEDDDSTVRGMRDAAWSHPDAAALLRLKGKRECSAFALDEDTGLLVKARFDLLPDEPFIVDVKTTECARLFEWERTCAKYGYHCQAAWYMDVRTRLLGATTGFFFIVIEKNPPYEVQVYQMGDASIEKGRIENARLLAEYKACVDSNVWPGYFSGIRQFDVPQWCLNNQPDQDQLTYQLES